MHNDKNKLRFLKNGSGSSVLRQTDISFHFVWVHPFVEIIINYNNAY